MNTEKKMGRHRLSTERRRSVGIVTYWSLAEAERLKQIAPDLGTSVAVLIREAMLDRLAAEDIDFPDQGFAGLEAIRRAAKRGDIGQ